MTLFIRQSQSEVFNQAYENPYDLEPAVLLFTFNKPNIGPGGSDSNDRYHRYFETKLLKRKKNGG